MHFNLPKQYVWYNTTAINAKSVNKNVGILLNNKSERRTRNRIEEYCR